MSDYLMKCLWKGVADVEQQQDAADRIEELEAKLAKAVGALVRIEDLTQHNMGMDARDERVVNREARTTLAGLKGQDDE